MSHIVSLLPLEADVHAQALQAVYAATPGYWALHGLAGPPPTQAAADLAEGNNTPGRHLLGIVRRLDPSDAAAGAEMIGVLDFRLHWPVHATVTIGMVMVAESYQRQGVATQAWSLLLPWLASTAGALTVRTSIEQFNLPALRFWEHMGLRLTGASDRIRSGDAFIRLLYMEQSLARDAAPARTGGPSSQGL